MTARILTSRNKREGGYLGRYVSVNDSENPARRRNHRKGSSSWRTLREGVRHFYRDATNDYHSPELVAFFMGAPLILGAA